MGLCHDPELVQSEGGCGTVQQVSRDKAASCNDESWGEDSVLDPVDCLEVVSGNNRLWAEGTYEETGLMLPPHPGAIS